MCLWGLAGLVMLCAWGWEARKSEFIVCFFKLKGFSVHCISFYGTEYLGGVSVAPQLTSGCLITANNKIYLVTVKQNRNS